MKLINNTRPVAMLKKQDNETKAYEESARYERDDSDRIYETVEENAQFPDGDEACYEWLSRNIVYPESARQKGIQGRVFTQFVINIDGSLENIRVLRSPDTSLSQEAERVIKLMPKWKPARLGNQLVRSRFNLPIMFRLP